MVGWLPIVPEDSDKSGKKAFVDFKRIVWHASVRKILESLLEIAGTPFVDADGVLRLLYPIILIISADFEEQCVMTAVCGMGSDFPCPICLIPSHELPGLDKTFAIRTAADMKSVYEEAMACELVGDWEAKLKSVSLRFVENAFWGFTYDGPYGSLGFDRLHAYHSGLFRKHLLQQFLDILVIAKRKVTSMVESRLAALPRWRDLTHFTHIAELREFSDGRKYEDLSKVILFASHNVFNPRDNERGYQWLLLTRSHLELDLWTGLLTHTSTTLRMGRAELQRFDAERKIYVTIWPDKKWDFPKAHSHAHVFDNIEEMGVTANMGTKGFEKMHWKPKIVWLLSNFKDLEKILSRFTSYEIAAMIIQNLIDIYDKELAELAEQEKQCLTPADGTPSIAQPPVDFSVGADDAGSSTDMTVDDGAAWVKPGAPTTGVLLSNLARLISPEYCDAFTGLRSKLRARITHDLELSRPAHLVDDLKVTMYRFLKVNYVSLEDSQVATDFIRFNPSFFGCSRYECALIQATNGKYMIAHIVTVFNLEYDKKKLQYALIIPFDLPVRHGPGYRTNVQRCKDLRFKQLRSREAKDSMLISTQYIIRSSFMIKDWGVRGCNDQYIVMDVVDPDFFLRMRTMGLGDLLLGG